MSNFHSINEEQKLYVIDAGGGYSCLGFDVCEARTLQYVAWLEGMGWVCPADKLAACRSKGTQAAYMAYEEICAIAFDLHRKTGVRCNAELTPQLIGLEGKWVEVVDKYDEKRQFKVGRSTGWAPIHLEIEGNADGGPGVSGTPFKSVQVISRPRKRRLAIG